MNARFSPRPGAWPQPPRPPAAGYTYIAVLLIVVTVGIGLLATGAVWSHTRQREREQELLFVGNQFRQAIESYYERSPGPRKVYPRRLEQLLEDDRYPTPPRHLRRIYADPMTGKDAWGIVTAPDGGIMGVYSQSSAIPIKAAGFSQRNRVFHGATAYNDWKFLYEPPAPRAPPPSVTVIEAPPGPPQK